MRPVGYILLALLLSGCPEDARNKAGAGPTPCKKLGQNCEYAPGKLGTCVVHDGCTQGDCFRCQSQH